MVYENVKKGFGLALKGWRGKTGLSQEELAWRAGLHRSYVADIERGARNPSLQTIEKLAKALKVSLATLLQPMEEAAAISELWREKEGAGRVSLSGGERLSLVEIILAMHETEDVGHILEAFRNAGVNNRVQVLEDVAATLDYIFYRGKYAKHRNHHTSLLLLDLDLPKVGGLEVLKKAKADPRTREMGVVVLARSGREQDCEEALRLGAEECLSKPIDFQRFTQITPRLNCRWTLVHEAGEGREER